MSDTASDSEERRNKDYHIIVNTEEKTVESDVVTYEDVTKLAYPVPPVANAIYTVTFEKAKEPPEGDLVKGQHVIVKDGTEFDVVPSGKS